MAAIYDVKPGRRGVPRLVSVRATALHDLENEVSVRRVEEAESWGRVRYLGNVIHLAVTAERPDIAAHSAGELVSLAQRRLRQLGPEEIA